MEGWSGQEYSHRVAMTDNPNPNRKKQAKQMAPPTKTPRTRSIVLATVEQLAFNLEDTLGTVRSALVDVECLTISEREWLKYLEEQLGLWHERLNRVDMFQPTLWDGHA